MLKGIPEILTPELVKTLMEMGHGDEIIFSDANFPAHSCNAKVIRLDGIDMCPLLEAVLKLFPLDTYQQPVYLMDKVPGDTVETPIWEDYKKIVKKHSNTEVGFLERFEFYERTKKAYAVVLTGEKALYANVLLKKGVI